MTVCAMVGVDGPFPKSSAVCHLIEPPATEESGLKFVLAPVRDPFGRRRLSQDDNRCRA